MKENNTYILAPYVSVGYKDGTLNLGYGQLNTKIEDNTLHFPLLVGCAFFKKPNKITDFFNLPFKEQHLLKIFSILTSNNYLINFNTYKDIPNSQNRLALNVLSKGYCYNDYIKMIKSKKVAIIGCGAIGTSMAISLVTNGVEKFTLVDEDIYNEENIYRSNHISLDMVLKRKTHTLKGLLESKNRKCIVDTIDRKIETDDKILDLDVDLIVLSADALHLLKKINAYCVDKKIPFIQVGYAHDVAVWGPLVIPGLTGCIQCRTFSLKKNISSKSDIQNLIAKVNSNYISPSPSYLVEFAVSNAIKDILDFFMFQKCRSLGVQLGISMDKFEVNEVEYAQHINCYCINNKNIND